MSWKPLLELTQTIAGANALTGRRLIAAARAQAGFSEIISGKNFKLAGILLFAEIGRAATVKPLQ
jgi:hypothetical protein